ncbi:hypothetical protein J7438_22045 [Thalassotalea sp. G20_0]|uniref:hypothetical protein n=1 Tax=Thalassotalea sp. G20_0 TaxID=2821093 RepID=UPI001ADB3F55|nr:hypothetical protein [Thalassotalea sp. G20_0]MBO9496745.1 hypothetical protein [Thalassotalea sp. G20_0]
MPFLKHWPSTLTINHLTIAGWIIGAYPEDEGKEMLDEMVSQIIREHMASSGSDEDEDIDGSRALFCELLDSMVEQRRTVFSDDSRFVTDFDVLRENGGYRLKVFSSVVPPTLFDDLVGEPFEAHKQRLLKSLQSLECLVIQ